MINSDGMKLTGHEGRKKDEKVHNNINSKPERNRAIGRSSCTWEDKIKLNLKNIQGVRM